MNNDIFSLDYQIQLCSLLIQDPNFLAVNHSLVKPEYFNNYHVKNIIRKVYEYYKTYSKAPTKEILSTLINELASREKLDPEIVYVYKARIDEIYSKETTDRDYIKKSIVTYCKKHEYVAHIEWCYRQLNNYEKDFENMSNLEADEKLLGEIDSRFLEVMAKGYSKDLGTSFRASLRNLHEIVKAESSVSRTPSGIDSLNKVMGGGYRNGGLYSWVAPPGTGKTTVLVSEACAALKQGKNVVYFTFEMTEPEILLKFVSNLMDITEQEMSNKDYLSAKVEEFDKLYSPNLVIKHYNEYEATTNTLISFCRQLELIGNVEVGLVAVDYADYLAPLKGLSDFMYEDKGNTYKDLKKLSINMDIPCLTASQTKQEGLTVDLIGMQHVEGSSMKGHIVDGMFSLNPRARPEHEVTAGVHPRLIIHEAKLRKRVGYGSTETKCRVDYAKSKVYEADY